MGNHTKAQRQAKRQQEDAALNRILIWFGGAVAAELILLLLNRLLSGPAAIRWLSFLVPVVAVLAMVYYLFQRDFFCICLISACGILSLQLYRRIFFLHPFRIRCGFALGFLLLAAAVAALILVQCGKRPLPLHIDRLIPKDANYPLLYITCALNGLVLALTLAFGSAAAYYLLFVLVGWLFVTAVYYIVKLI